jgi:hypothetical protein
MKAVFALVALSPFEAVIEHLSLSLPLAEHVVLNIYLLCVIFSLMLQPGAGELLAVLARHPHELQLQRRALRAAASRLRSSTSTSNTGSSSTVNNANTSQQQQKASHSGGDAAQSDVAADVTTDAVSGCTFNSNFTHTAVVIIVWSTRSHGGCCTPHCDLM